MALLPIELNELAAVVNVFHDGLFWIQLPPELIKVGNLQVRAAPDLARGRLQLPKNQLEKSGFASPVLADQPYPIAPQNDPGIVPDDFRLARIGKSHVFSFHDKLARLARFLQANPGLTLLLAPLGALYP